jgi:hypothetical protein
MTSKKLFNNLKRQHEQAEMMLPWLNSDKLNKSEKFQVMQHLEICDHCRIEWSESQTLKSAFRVRKEQQQWQPSEAHFNRLLNRLDTVATPVTEKIAADIPDAIVQTSSLHRSADNLSATILQLFPLGRQGSRIKAFINSLLQFPSLLRWLLGLESIALVSICLVFLMTETKVPVTETASYETLIGSSISGVEPHKKRISLIFDAKMTESDIRKLLQSTKGQVVSGPSDLGVYTVELAPSFNTKAEIEDLQAVYRNNPRVRVLEP